MTVLERGDMSESVQELGSIPKKVINILTHLKPEAAMPSAK